MPPTGTNQTELERVEGEATPSPLVSVIIPAYNYEQFIGQTLTSVQAQSYEHWECLVIDDDSTDKTSEVVASYAQNDCRIKYLHQRNQRQAAARNNGLRNARGRYLQFLDADDLIEKYKLERQVRYLERCPEIDIVYGSVRYFPTDNVDERRFSLSDVDLPWMPQVSGFGKDVLPLLVRSNIMAINSPLMRRSVVDDVGPFDEKLPPLEDWDFWMRCANRGKRFQYDETEGTMALVRSHSASSSRNQMRMMQAAVRMRRKWVRSIDLAGVSELNRELLSKEAWFLGLEEVLSGSVLKGSGSLIQAGMAQSKFSHKSKMLLCASLAPFVSKKQFQVIASSSLTEWMKGLWRRQRVK